MTPDIEMFIYLCLCAGFMWGSFWTIKHANTLHGVIDRALRREDAVYARSTLRWQVFLIIMSIVHFGLSLLFSYRFVKVLEEVVAR